MTWQRSGEATATGRSHGTLQSSDRSGRSHGTSVGQRQDESGGAAQAAAEAPGARPRADRLCRPHDRARVPRGAESAYATPERRPFNFEEQAAILRVAEANRLYVMVVLAQATGLRQSELLASAGPPSTWMRGCGMSASSSAAKGSSRTSRRRPGNGPLPIPARVAEVLRLHRAEQERKRVEVAYWEDHDLVLSTRNGQPISQRNAHRSWTRILVQAGVEHRGVHHMRHAYVTMFAEQGVHERVAQQLADRPTAESHGRSTHTSRRGCSTDRRGDRADG